MSGQPTQSVGICIPDGVQFADLKLSRDPVDGDVSFDWAPIEKICAASDLDIALFKEQHENNVGALITAWYDMHRAAGGVADLVAEQLIAEVQAESLGGEAKVQRGPGTLQ